MAAKRWRPKLVATSRIRRPAKRTRVISLWGGGRKSTLMAYTPRRNVRGQSQYRARQGYTNTWSWLWPLDRFGKWFK